MSTNPVRVLVSACLLGQPVRYDGQSKGIVSDWLSELGAEGRALAFCPEVAGGLPTPRPPAERQGERVVTASGLDVTAEIEAQGIPNGVYVQTVEPDSPAMAAGIQSGDIITEAAGKKISSLAVYQSVMRDQKSGSKIRLKGQRQGSGGYVDISFDVTVGSKE